MIFQFALKSIFFELEISVLDKNREEFYQKLIGICLRIVMMENEQYDGRFNAQLRKLCYKCEYRGTVRKII